MSIVKIDSDSVVYSFRDREVYISVGLFYKLRK